MAKTIGSSEKYVERCHATGTQVSPRMYRLKLGSDFRCISKLLTRIGRIEAPSVSERDFVLGAINAHDNERYGSVMKRLGFFGLRQQALTACRKMDDVPYTSWQHLPKLQRTIGELLYEAEMDIDYPACELMFVLLRAPGMANKVEQYNAFRDRLRQCESVNLEQSIKRYRELLQDIPRIPSEDYIDMSTCVKARLVGWQRLRYIFDSMQKGYWDTVKMRVADESGKAHTVIARQKLDSIREQIP